MATPFDNDSVGAFLDREFEERISRFSGREHRLRRAIFEQRLLTECMITGAHSMHDVALSEAGCFQDLPGVHYVIPPGFETVVEILRRSIPPSRILLKHRVNRVAWRVPGGNGVPPVTVECANGVTIRADVALVTISLGYLKAHAARLFDPPLPTLKTDAIRRVGMGTVDKVILEFDGQILPDGVFRLEMVWDREQDGVGDAGQVGEGSGGETEGRDLTTRWVRKIGFFEAVSDNVVIGWLSGMEAEYMEKLTEEQIGEACVAALQKFLSKTTPTLPRLKKVTRSMWKSNPYALGSYCHIPVGASADDIVALGEPVCDSTDKPVLLFAGEATHPTFYSSSHGALLSGRREAQRIIHLLTPAPLP